MAIFKNNPPIVTDGLVFNIDAANLMSFDSRNLLTNTEDFTNGSAFGGWLNLPFGGTIIQRTGSAAIAPDGTLSATEVYKEAGVGLRQQSSFGFINVGDTMTFSVYAKAKSGSSSITLDIADEGGKTWSINDTEWTRCYTTVTYIGQYYPNGRSFVDITLPLTQSIYLWGAQWNFGQLIDYVPVGSTIPPVKNLADRTITGSLVNRPVYKNDNGGTFRFDGVDDELQLSDEIQLDESWTLNYWQQLNITQNTFSIPSLFRVTPQGGTSSPGYFSVDMNAFTSVISIHIDSSDNIYVGGQYGGYDNIVRDTLVKINEDGSPNSQFNSGIAISNANVIACNKIQQLSNGNLVTIGTNWGPAGVLFFNPVSGTIVPSLTTATVIGSSFILDEPNNSMWVLDSWANIYQNQNTSGKIFKINLTDFSIDTTFDSSTGFKSTVGKTTVSNTEGVNDGIVLQDGNLLCIGTFMEYKGVPTSRIVKINSTTAALDTSFVYGTGFNNQTYGAIQMNNGTIVVVGQFTNYNGSSVNRIVGLNNDGSINTGFNVGTGFNNRVNSVIYDSVNDKLFCFGLFTTYNGTAANGIVKLNSDGSIDTSFDYGTGFNTITSTGALDTQGRLVVLSQPTATYQGQTIPRRICRINTNGTLDTTFNSGGFNIDRFRQDTIPRLVDNTSPYIVGGFYGINSNREIINLPGGAMTFNGFKLYTIAFNHNTNQVLGYINGVLTKTTTLTARLPFRGKTFRSYEKFFNFNIYNRQLSQQEITQNYNATKTRFNLT